MERLDETNIDVLHTLVIYEMCNPFWQHAFCNVYWLWQPDKLHQLLLQSVKDLLHQLLKYMKARNVKDQFDNQFTLVSQYVGLLHFTDPLDWLTSSTWQREDTWGMNRTLAVNCVPILDCSIEDGKTAVETASDEIIMKAVWTLCEFSLHVSQQNHSDSSLTALDNAAKQLFKQKVAFLEQKWWSLWRPKRMNHSQENASYNKNKRSIQSLLLWWFRCTGLKWIWQQTADNLSYAWIEPDKWQPNGQIQIGRGQQHDWSVKSICWFMLNASFLSTYSNIMSNNDCRKLGVCQPVPEAHLPKYYPKRRPVQRNRVMAWEIVPPSSVYNSRNVYPILRVWDWSHHLEYHWYRLYCAWAAKSDIWYHFEWADAIQQGILHPCDQDWSLVVGNWPSGALEKLPMACNTFWTSQRPSCAQYIWVNSSNWFWPQYHHWYFWTATNL